MARVTGRRRFPDELDLTRFFCRIEIVFPFPASPMLMLLFWLMSI